MPADANSTRVVLIHAASGSSAAVQLHGATLTSWKPARDGVERIFVSPRAVLDGSKAIRGGIPLVFPQFGTLPTSKLPQHGFARTSKWAWKGIVAETNDELSAAFSLTPAAVNPELYAMWPHPFELTYTVTLRGKDVLETSLKVDNKGSEAFEFTALLHTYFAAEDISKCAVSGMQGTTYADKVAGGTHTESNHSITFPSETDRVYSNVPDDVTILTPHPLLLSRNNMLDVVLWTPYEKKAGAMTDLGDAWRGFLCVEAGAVDKNVKVEAGGSWEGGQVIRAL